MVVFHSPGTNIFFIAFKVLGAVKAAHFYTVNKKCKVKARERREECLLAGAAMLEMWAMLRMMLCYAKTLRLKLGYIKSVSNSWINVHINTCSFFRNFYLRNLFVNSSKSSKRLPEATFPHFLWLQGEADHILHKFSSPKAVCSLGYCCTILSPSQVDQIAVAAP